MSRSVEDSASHRDYAFPSDTPPACRNGQDIPFGLTKREYIAAAALQGILAHAHNDSSYEGAARDAVVYTDALLKELAK